MKMNWALATVALVCANQTQACSAEDSAPPRGSDPDVGSLEGDPGERRGGTRNRGDVGQTTAELTVEKPGTVDLVSRFRLTNAELMLKSHAASLRAPGAGCSGAMIGPNVLMTAGHCGRSSTTTNVTFYSYTDIDQPTTYKTETFGCRTLFTLFEDADLTLWHCDAKNGQNPGDRYGYLDLDYSMNAAGTVDVATSDAQLTVGKPVGIFWWNWLDQPALADAIFFSPGTLTKVASSSSTWHTVNSACSGDPYYRASGRYAESNVWVKTGVSGGALLNRTNYRVLVGPISTAQDAAAGSAFLRATTLLDQTVWGRIYNPNGGQSCDGKSRKQLHADVISSLGLTPTNYEYEWVDYTVDGVFDIQHDLELRTGERQRAQYWLGFESNRRNKMWQSQATTFEIVQASARDGYAHLAATSEWLHWALYHPYLNLKPSTKYQVGGWIRSTTGRTETANVCTGNCGVEQQVTAGPNWSLFSVTVTTPAGTPRALSISLYANAAVDVYGRNMVEQGMSHSFDTHDSRMIWRSVATNGTPFILPVGNGAAVNWAAMVRRSVINTSTEWILKNDQSGFPAASQVRVCYDHVTKGALQMLRSWANVAVTDSAGATRIHEAYYVPTGWSNRCTAWFATTPASTLWFGTSSGLAAPGEAYFIDNVRIESL